ncbi:DUF4238 domain-containing protein [Streptomyces angustmyceticus]|uniref:DUF4238 domain-containing protein n=1 Tax=Streptomyces angustmyceticus TaxID=285578 RepID=A0A5J4LRW3_9ACTN|nr:DUF4238 domain-containing protein [Streptomyces angustmyceticus]GES34751.1 hypothetical protein San01_72390 [Streptomyces angustmyceticus]
MPQYWLRAFAEDGHVLGRRRRGGAEHRTPVRRAAVARHFNTDPLADGERRVALETYLDRHVDGPCAPVLRVLREGQWPLDEAQHALALDALAWQVVRTQAFRSFDEQVGHHLFPALWAQEAVGYSEEQLGRPLSEAERLEVFWTAVRTAPDPSVIVDPRSALRASIRAFERTQGLLAAPGRRLVLLRSAEPLLVLADSGIALRRKDGTFGLTPPLLPETIEVFAPLSPTCLLISTPRAHYRPHRGLTRKIAAKANAGAAAWCQDAVYRPPSMPWPTHLPLAESPLEVRPPRLSAVPAQQPAGPAPTHPEIRRGELRAILEQLSHTPADQPPGSGTGGRT